MCDDYISEYFYDGLPAKSNRIIYGLQTRKATITELQLSHSHNVDASITHQLQANVYCRTTTMLKQ